MAYGTPRDLSDVEPYYRDIRGGRAPSPEAVEELTERYRMVGGKTPLLEITQSVANLLEERLNRDSGEAQWRVYIGMKHWYPYIAEGIDRIAADGVSELVALPLAPHYSRMSIAGYEEIVERNLERIESAPPTRFIESWHANPLFIEFIAQRISEGLGQLGLESSHGVEVLFTAHSLPTRILDYGDPYPQELMESAAAVACAAKVDSWRFAYQSAGKTGTPWLGPDILDSIEEISPRGHQEHPGCALRFRLRPPGDTLRHRHRSHGNGCESRSQTGAYRDAERLRRIYRDTLRPGNRWRRSQDRGLEWLTQLNGAAAYGPTEHLSPTASSAGDGSILVDVSDGDKRVIPRLVVSEDAELKLARPARVHEQRRVCSYLE